MLPILPTTIVGSLPQPDWLIDRARLLVALPPRVRMRDLWRVAPEWLEQAQDDATRVAIADQERAGIDIVTDGEQTRRHFVTTLIEGLDGVDFANRKTRAWTSCATASSRASISCTDSSSRSRASTSSTR